MKKKIIEHLLKIGVKPQSKGFGYLVKAIEMTVDNDGVLPSMTKTIYPEIAKIYGDKANGVERACRYAKIEAKQPYCSLSNGEFIARISLGLKMGKLD